MPNSGERGGGNKPVLAVVMAVSAAEFGLMFALGYGKVAFIWFISFWLTWLFLLVIELCRAEASDGG